jgi:hypothetical protein
MQSDSNKNKGSIKDKLYLYILRIDKDALVRHRALPEKEQIEIAVHPTEFLRKTCVAAVTPYHSVIMELVKTDDDAVKLSLALNPNITPEAVDLLIYKKNPLTGLFMGEFNNSVGLLSSGFYKELGVIPVVTVRPFVVGDSNLGFDIIEGLVEQPPDKKTHSCQ